MLTLTPAPEVVARLNELVNFWYGKFPETPEIYSKCKLETLAVNHDMRFAYILNNDHRTIHQYAYENGKLLKVLDISNFPFKLPIRQIVVRYLYMQDYMIFITYNADMTSIWCRYTPSTNGKYFIKLITTLPTALRPELRFACIGGFHYLIVQDVDCSNFKSIFLPHPDGILPEKKEE